MSIAVLASTSVIKLFIIVLVGYAATKCNILTEKRTEGLTSLLTMVVLPLMVFTNHIKPYDSKMLKGLIISFVCGIVSHFLMLIMAKLFIRKNSSPDWAIEQTSCVMTNCGFVGYPLMGLMFGSEGIFYFAGFATSSVFYIFVYGLITISEKNNRRDIINAILNPTIVANLLGFVFFALRLSLPDIVLEPLTDIGSCNTPLAMIIAGSAIARSDIMAVVRNKKTYLVCFVKLIIAPLLSFLLVPFVVGEYDIIAMSIIIGSACPTGSLGIAFAIQYGKNAGYASGLFAFSTLLSMISIPLIMSLYSIIFSG